MQINVDDIQNSMLVYSRREALNQNKHTGPNKHMTTANPIKIKETIETYDNAGNPSHPCNGQQILTVSIVEICPWVGEFVVKNFGGMFDQDDSQIRADALDYYKTKAAADIIYFDKYQSFIVRMDKTEWEF